MKQALAILVVLAFVASLSSAASYHPTKDTFWRSDSNLDGQGAGNDTFGGASEQRAGKGWQDGFYMDFDRTAVLADASAQLGHTATAADFTNGTVSLTLQLMGLGGGEGFNHAAAYTPGYFTSSTNWTNHATYLYADRDSVSKWNTTGTTIRDCPGAKGTAQVWAAADYTYQTFTIDNNVAAGFLFATAPGDALIMWGDDWQNNGHVYASEGIWVDGTSYAGPILTVVPEPCSMLLIAAGAVATLIRRRK